MKSGKTVLALAAVIASMATFAAAQVPAPQPPSPPRTYAISGLTIDEVVTILNQLKLSELPWRTVDQLMAKIVTQVNAQRAAEQAQAPPAGSAPPAPVPVPAPRPSDAPKPE